MKMPQKSRIVLCALILAGTLPLASCQPRPAASSSNGQSGDTSTETSHSQSTDGSSASATGQTSASVAQLKQILIAKEPTKTTYEVGDVFDPTGMIVKASYDDGSEKTITDYTYDLHQPLTLQDASVTVTYQGKNATVAITVKAKQSDPTVASIQEEGTVRFEAENADVSHYKFSSANPAAVVERADASGGKFLAAATGDIAAAGYFSFSIDVGFDAKLSMKAAYAQTEKWKSYDEDMTKAYNYLIDDNYSVRLSGDHILAARDDITHWDTITYDDFTLTKGTHNVKVSVIANTSKGNPNIDYLDFACLKAGSANPGDDTKVPANDFHTYLQYSYLLDNPANFASYATGAASLSKPRGIKLDFSDDPGVIAASTYVVQFSTSSAFEYENSTTVIGIPERSYVYQNALLGQQIYFRGANDQAKLGAGVVHELTVSEQGPRNLDVDGIDNFRDCGGYATSLKEGAKTKQGFFYRGAKPNDVTDKGKNEMTGHLGIKQEIDLRDSSQCTGPYIDGIAYSPISIPSGTEATRFEGFAEEYCQVFDLLSKADQNPVYLHCTAGADRTGIMSFALMSVLGNSYNDLLRDYCFTNFSSQGLRDPNNEFANWWTKLNSYEGSDKASQAKNWLISKGIPSATIEHIREIFIDGYTAEKDDPVLGSDAIALKAGATVRFEAENANLDSYVISSANSSKIVERADASGGKFLAAATGANKDSQYFSFQLYCSKAVSVTMRGAYAQPDKYKTNAMDMTKTYQFLVDGQPAFVATGEDTTLDARTDIAVWESFVYPSFAVSEGMHTVKGLVVTNTGLGNPNIDYFDLSANLVG